MPADADVREVESAAGLAPVVVDVWVGGATWSGLEVVVSA